MLIRIFGFKDYGINKYINLLRLQMGNGRPWTIELCDPMKWTPSKGDIHIYMEFPVRLAVPWASFNVFATGGVLEAWAWTKEEMDLTLKLSDLTERETAVPAFRRLFTGAMRLNHPPALPVAPAAGAAPPKVGIITVTRNRKDWWINMLQNVVKQTWPVSRLEWIIVDDGDEDQRLGSLVDEFMEKSPGIMIRYVEILTPKTIGYKRNAAVAAAAEDVDVFVCMDDDDHYPKDSVGRRVAWLHRDLRAKTEKDKKVTAVKQQSQIGYCSTLPMYDVTRYISAVNVPTLENGPAERVSEASLVFTRAAWTARSFPEVSMAEGLGFLEGREAESVEIPPNDVIVSFIHKGNTSSRRMPAAQEPNGCHFGFADEFFTYIHKIGSDKVE